MQYDVKFACGHICTVTLFGKQSSRDYEMEKMKNRICDACYQKQIIAEQRALGLPELTDGSEKQIAWAIKIRQNFIHEKNKIEREMNREFNDARENKQNYSNVEEQIEFIKSSFDDFCAELFSETDAKKWIDKHNDVRRLTSIFRKYLSARRNSQS